MPFNRPPQHSTIAEEYRKDAMPDGDPKQWSTGLFMWHDVFQYAFACACPCMIINDVYDKLMDAKRDTPQTTACASMCLSALITAPLCFCADQFSTRTMDYLVDRPMSLGQQEREWYPPHPNEEASHPPPSSSFPWNMLPSRNAFSYVLTNNPGIARFGHTHPEPSWERDSYGWDLPENSSEDWWPCQWFNWHLYQACSAVCCHRSCCGGDAPRLPLCFNCLLGAFYPMLVCPITCVVRQMVAHEFHIDENCFKTCGISFCCYPCAIVQIKNHLNDRPHPANANSNRLINLATTTTAAPCSFNGQQSYTSDHFNF
jgi:hypothetical protein